MLNFEMSKKAVKKLYELNQMFKKYFKSYTITNGIVVGECVPNHDVLRCSRFIFNNTFNILPLEMFDGFIIDPEALNLAIKTKGIDTLSIIDDKLSLVVTNESLVLPFGKKKDADMFILLHLETQPLKVNLFNNDDYTMTPELLEKIVNCEKVTLDINKDKGLIVYLTIETMPILKKVNMVTYSVFEDKGVKEIFHIKFTLHADDFICETLFVTAKTF